MASLFFWKMSLFPPFNSEECRRPHTRDRQSRWEKVAPREVDNPLSLNERRLPPAVNAAFEHVYERSHLTCSVENDPVSEVKRPNML